MLSGVLSCSATQKHTSDSNHDTAGYRASARPNIGIRPPLAIQALPTAKQHAEREPVEISHQPLADLLDREPAAAGGRRIAAERPEAPHPHADREQIQEGQPAELHPQLRPHVGIRPGERSEQPSDSGKRQVEADLDDQRPFHAEPVQGQPRRGSSAAASSTTRTARSSGSWRWRFRTRQTVNATQYPG